MEPKIRTKCLSAQICCNVYENVLIYLEYVN